MLGGSWAVIGGAISRVTVVITRVRGLITHLDEPPSTDADHNLQNIPNSGCVLACRMAGV